VSGGVKCAVAVNATLEEDQVAGFTGEVDIVVEPVLVAGDVTCGT
jgi:hypothetical protein